MPVAIRPEDVGLELGAIPHRDVDVLLDLHLVSGFGRFALFAGRDLLLHGTSQRSCLRAQRYQRARLAAMQPEAGHIRPSPTPRARSRPRGGAWRARLPRPWCCRRLRAQCELLQRGVLARLVDATLELVLRFELAALGRDQTEDGHLAPGQKTQRFEAAGARAVIFEK